MGMDKYGCFMQMYVYYYWNLSQHRVDKSSNETASPGHGADNNNTTANIKVPPSFIAYKLSGWVCFLFVVVVFVVMQIFPHRDVDMWGRVWMIRFRGVWQSLTFIKDISLGLRH